MDILGIIVRDPNMEKNNDSLTQWGFLICLRYLELWNVSLESHNYKYYKLDYQKSLELLLVEIATSKDKNPNNKTIS